MIQENNNLISLYNLSIAAEIRLNKEYLEAANISLSNIYRFNGYWLQIYNQKVFLDPYYSEYPIVITDIGESINLIKTTKKVTIFFNNKEIIEIIEWKNNKIHNVIHYKFIYVKNDNYNFIKNNKINYDIMLNSDRIE